MWSGRSLKRRRAGISSNIAIQTKVGDGSALALSTGLIIYRVFIACPRRSSRPLTVFRLGGGQLYPGLSNQLRSLGSN